MTTLSTHDTKRSEDVRAPGGARRAAVGVGGLVRGWLQRHPLADRPLAHLVWQNLVGAWPLSRERAHAYVEKAAREAATSSTTWTAPDEEFEGQLHALVDAAFDDPATHGGDRGVRQPDRPVRLVELAVAEAAAADDARRPDVYQGTELWDFSLVDPTTAAGGLRAAPQAARRPRRR